MARHHSVLEVAALTLVGLTGLVAFMVGVSGPDTVALSTAVGLLTLTALIWRGGRAGTPATVVGLAAVIVFTWTSGGAIAVLAAVVLCAWAGDRLTRLVRIRQSRRDPA